MSALTVFSNNPMLFC